MPSAVEFQRLADELRQIENAIIQAASDGDQELVQVLVVEPYRLASRWVARSRCSSAKGSPKSTEMR